MEIKQKHGKHALRKAVTAAVLAGTAFSSLGGFAGAVSTVKADELDPRVESIDSEALLRIRREFEKDRDVEKFREELKKVSTESLHAILLGLDNASPSYSEGGGYFGILSNTFGTMPNDNNLDWLHWKGLSFASILIQEVRDRLNSKDKLSEELILKNDELKELSNKLEKSIKEKEKLDKNIEEKNKEIADKEENEFLSLYNARLRSFPVSSKRRQVFSY